MFLSPKGVPFSQRALPPGVGSQPLRRFEVLKPFPVKSGTIAPAFGEIGYGTQMVTPVKLKTLLKKKIIKEIDRR